MASKDQESRNAPDDALALNKETLQDLDLEPLDAENVKGGGIVMSQLCGGGPRATDTTTTQPVALNSAINVIGTR